MFPHRLSNPHGCDSLCPYTLEVGQEKPRKLRWKKKKPEEEPQMRDPLYGWTDVQPIYKTSLPHFV